MSGEELVLVALLVVILAGVAMLWMAMNNRRHLREMEHRERLAMIERGLIPQPELDPGGFERRGGLERAPEPASATRSRSAGVIMVGLGLAFMTLLTFAAGAPEVGVGIGGAFALLGAAFFVNALLVSRQTSVIARSVERQQPAVKPTVPPPPAPPPTNLEG